ncbi:hypothetical protein [Tenacibaculum agarivorans]|uniref:hypothetical protein n=1 Tax=Tenacibaculum agarivorans TaxID=1908389 RepID=UPI000AFCD4D4|nr:hypothetical protein [Tenacibaculum agarivorans]
MKSSSNLLNYISHLMQDDDALYKFTIDPITTSEQEHGLTKAERAVLRRTVHGLSNNSLNGYSIVRNLDSYRRSLRLLQNVLSNVGTKMIMDHSALEKEKKLIDVSSQYIGVTVYVPQSAFNGTLNYTKFTNQQVGNPYYAPAYFQIPATSTMTIKAVLDQLNTTNELPYATIENSSGELLVNGFNPYTYFEDYLIADLTQYNLTDDYAFWFYSINGKAGPNNSGMIGQSFANFNVSPGDTIVWQLIAPDAQYGFQPCAPHEDNVYAKTIKQ